MAYKITDFTRSLAPHTGYPYGDTQDDPGGTLVNRLAMNDIFLFFQRLCATNGITPSSNADNDVNGYQFVQALNALVNNGQNAFAAQFAAIGTVSGSAVCVYGCVSTSSGPTTTISSGFIFYNGQFIKVNGFSYSIIPGGYSLYISIGTVDGLPTGTISFLVNTIPENASQFLYSNLNTVDRDHPTASIKIASTIVPFTSAWSDYSEARYFKDDHSKVVFKGRIGLNGSSYSSGICTAIPSNIRPAVDTICKATYIDATTGAYVVIFINIVASTGSMYILNYTALVGLGYLSHVGDLIELNGIEWYTF